MSAFTGLAMFNLNIKHLFVEFLNFESRNTIKYKLFVDDVERKKGSLKDSKQSDRNIWCFDSGLSILASKDSKIRIALSKRRRVHKREFASFQFSSTDLLSGPPSEDNKDEKTFSVTVTDVDHNDIILRTSTFGEPEPVNTIAHSLIEKKNSIIEFLKPFQSHINTLNDFSKAATEANPIAKAVAEVISVVWKKCSNALDLDDSLVKLLKDIIDLLPDLVTISENAILPSLKDTLSRLEKKINEAFVFIENFRTASFAAGLTKIDEGNKIIMEIKELKASLLLRINTQQLKQITESNKKKLLETLNPVTGADTRHQHHSCLEGTRTAIIEEMTSWVSNDDTAMFWLNGLPGVGKSSIACSVMECLRASGVPTVPFFCQRNINNYNDATRVVQTMTYYLACLVPKFADCLLQKLDGRGLDSSPFAHYSDKLRDIVCNALEATQWDGRAVLLVDALDECTIHREQAVLAKVLLELTQRCNWLKVMITSRPYKDIERFFTDVEQSRMLEINYKMSATDPLNMFSDLLKYTEHCFKLSLTNEREKVELLARRANGLFQWVTVASQFVEDSVNKKAALNALLDLNWNTNADALEQLYVLYQAVLTKCLNLKFKTNASAYSTFFATLISLRTHLDAKAMSALVDDLDPDTIEEICKSLRSVINIEESGLIVIAHQSFADYLSSATQHHLLPPMLRIDLAVANTSLALKCLDTMLGANGLKFNICALETSAKFNKDISDLGDKIGNYIPMQLHYACLHWLDHYNIAQSPSRDEVKLMQLLSTEKMLFWLEVLSLTGNVEVGMQIQHLKGSRKAETLASEVYNFVKTFIAPMARSTPHLYVSALPFVPRQSYIYKTTKAKFEHLVDVISGFDTYWTTTSMVLQCQSYVNTVAFSYDGRWIVSGSEDGKIRIWDAMTGTSIGEPLEGHTGSVYSVAFSPDGSKVVSGSGDKTIRLWNVRTGSMIGKPLEGHSDCVSSVAFSPDASKIVSGSFDKTIRLWDVQTGILIGKPLEGHSDYVNSMAFSPDGAKVVSGSNDTTIRAWDIHTGTPIGEPLKGHSSYVLSVTFSPDVTKIVSTSYDKTIRVWDVQTGTLIGKPLEGHSDRVNSVAFSPDGTKIASGSDDSTVRLWDVQTGTPLGESLIGHSNVVSSVAFSLDGARVVSGSFDETIRVWDVQTEKPVGNLSEGHSDSVRSVAFSPDGTLIASGSVDNTVRVWNLQIGTPIGRPLEGHSAFVNSLDFSPDGMKIVSGSDDRTVRLWDVKTGASIGEPLEGHSSRVNSVTFSPDGGKIASGSDEGMIRVWDVQTGASIGEPLEGHSFRVNSLAFSPDGTKIVSGSDDRTVMVWNVQTWNPIGISLKGHSDVVSSVAFSPDGRKIVSGSYDKTIRMWDIQTGTLIGEPLEGHSGYVNSVNFSPNGTKIVSGSNDRTVRVWDVQSGSQTGDPLDGHSSRVNSVAFSPDGTKIVSGSDDTTIRVWNAEADQHRTASTVTSVDNIRFFQKSCRKLEADGWTYSEDGKSPLLWALTDLRHGVRSGSLLCIGGRTDERAVTLDFSDFAYGNKWNEIFTGS